MVIPLQKEPPIAEKDYESELVFACLKNELWAQKQLYERYCRKMFGLCLRYAHNKEEAEDLLQEGFVKVFKNISRFRGEGSLEGWIRKIILNTVFEEHRKKKLTVYQVDTWEMREDLHPEAESALSQQSANDLLTMIQQLPDGYRRVFNLFAIEGYSHQEISEMLEISEGTSKSQYSRARALLQKMVLAGTK